MQTFTRPWQSFLKWIISFQFMTGLHIRANSGTAVALLVSLKIVSSACSVKTRHWNWSALSKLALNSVQVNLWKPLSFEFESILITWGKFNRSLSAAFLGQQRPNPCHASGGTRYKQAARQPEGPFPSGGKPSYHIMGKSIWRRQ